MSDSKGPRSTGRSGDKKTGSGWKGNNNNSSSNSGGKNWNDWGSNSWSDREKKWNNNSQGGNKNYGSSSGYNNSNRSGNKGKNNNFRGSKEGNRNQRDPNPGRQGTPNQNQGGLSAALGQMDQPMNQPIMSPPYFALSSTGSGAITLNGGIAPKNMMTPSMSNQSSPMVMGNLNQGLQGMALPDMVGNAVVGTPLRSGSPMGGGIQQTPGSAMLPSSPLGIGMRPLSPGSMGNPAFASLPTNQNSSDYVLSNKRTISPGSGANYGRSGSPKNGNNYGRSGSPGAGNHKRSGSPGAGNYGRSKSPGANQTPTNSPSKGSALSKPSSSGRKKERPQDVKDFCKEWIPVSKMCNFPVSVDVEKNGVKKTVRIFTCKCPLDRDTKFYVKSVETEPVNSWSPEDLLQTPALAKDPDALALMLNLAGTAKYYDPMFSLDEDGNRIEHSRSQMLLENGFPNTHYHHELIPGRQMPTPEVIFKVVRLIYEEVFLNPSPSPMVLIHCTHGINRTGLITSAFMIRYGRSRDLTSAREIFEKSRGESVVQNFLLEALEPLVPKLVALCDEEIVEASTKTSTAASIDNTFSSTSTVKGPNTPNRKGISPATSVTHGISTGSGTGFNTSASATTLDEYYRDSCSSAGDIGPASSPPTFGAIGPISRDISAGIGDGIDKIRNSITKASSSLTQEQKISVISAGAAVLTAGMFAFWSSRKST